MRTVFILVPSPRPTGPVKGAYALANALAPLRRVTIVFLKRGPGADAPLDARVEVVSLFDTPGGWRGRLNAYQELLRRSGGREQAGSISMCLSADWLNRFCRGQAVTCASVRGNLPQNYRLDYGWTGTFAAVGHLLALRAFDHVVAMTETMARQIWSIAAIRTKVIGNFVDEAALDHYRQPTPRTHGPWRFIFVGSLTERKQPEQVVHAIEALAGHDVRLDIIGDGPLRQAIEASLSARGLRDRVHFHGQMADPYPLVADTDVFVLPSRSEGVSRAALEALHLGVPCVMRDVDGNAELLAEPTAGALFMRDTDLADVMLKTAMRSRDRPDRATLLPPSFRQATGANRYLALLEETA